MQSIFHYGHYSFLSPMVYTAQSDTHQTSAHQYWLHAACPIDPHFLFSSCCNNQEVPLESSAHLTSPEIAVKDVMNFSLSQNLIRMMDGFSTCTIATYQHLKHNPGRPEAN